MSTYIYCYTYLHGFSSNEKLYKWLATSHAHPKFQIKKLELELSNISSINGILNIDVYRLKGLHVQLLKLHKISWKNYVTVRNRLINASFLIAKNC